MTRVAVVDACVLHPASVRDLLVRIARAGIVGMRWSDRILDEWQRAVERARPDLASPVLSRTRQRLVDAVEDCLVVDFEALIGGLSLPDPNDRHVVAAAIAARAHVIVTFNMRDFPAETLEAFGIEAMHPDSFLLDLMNRDPTRLAQIIVEQAGDLKHPPLSPAEVLAHLERDGLPMTAKKLRALLEVRSP